MIATSCFVASTEEEIQKCHEIDSNNLSALTFDKFTNQNQETLHYANWQIGLAMLRKGLELIRDENFKKSIHFLQELKRSQILNLDS